MTFQHSARVTLGLLVLGGSGCIGGSQYGDLEVDWSIADSIAVGQCAAYGATWAHVLIDGPDFSDDIIDCEEFGLRYVELRPGIYFVHVDLLDSDEVAITTASEFYTDVFSGDLTVETVNFPPDSFLISLLGDLSVEWSIDGAQAASLCQENGVTSASVDVQGPDDWSNILDCTDFEVTLTDLPIGDYDVSVTLLDENDQPLTDAQDLMVQVGSDDVSVVRADFDATEISP